MKKRDIERILRDLGYQLARSTKHDIWSNAKVSIPVPQHKEIKYFTARQIIRKAEQYV